MPENMKHSVLSKRKDILSKVKDYINNHLNPVKVNFYDSSRDTILNLKSVSEVLEELNITGEEYKKALQISDNQDFQHHLKRQKGSAHYKRLYTHYARIMAEESLSCFCQCQ